MSKLLDRLRGYDIQLIPPICSTQKQENSFLSSIQQFRNSVYSEFSYVPPDDLVSDPNNTDSIAWHLVISRSEQIFGCIRFVVIDPSEAVDIPAKIIAYNRVQFSLTDYQRCLSALTAYIQDWQKTGNPLVLVGGLAVADRQTAIGPALCLAGNAFARLTGSSTGLIFAATMMGKRKLYTKAGCHPHTRCRRHSRNTI